MSAYMTEEEQLARIKKWWEDYGTWVLVGLSFILLCVAGYRYWHWHEDKLTMQASNTYEQLMIAFSNQNNQQVEAYANQLIGEYGKTVYADVARLTLAKLHASEEHYKKALETLEYVADHAKMTALAQVAKLRIARMRIAEKEYNKALAELDTMANSIYGSLVDELKGDVYMATGQSQQALSSYKEALAKVNSQGMGNPFLEMKANEMRARTS